MCTRAGLLVLAVLAVALAVGASMGCDEEPEIFPTDGLKVWIAQSVSGRTLTSLTDEPLPGITVVFRAGMARNYKLEIARDVTGVDGRFAMQAAGTSQGDSGYWRFIVDRGQPVRDDGTLVVYCELVVTEGDSVRAYPLELIRHPTSDVPDPLPTYFIERTIVIPWRYAARNGATLHVP